MNKPNQDFHSASGISSKQKKLGLIGIGVIFTAMGTMDFVLGRNSVSTLRWSWLIDPIAAFLGKNGLPLVELTIGLIFIMRGIAGSK